MVVIDHVVAMVTDLRWPRHTVPLRSRLRCPTRVSTSTSTMMHCGPSGRAVFARGKRKLVT